MADSDNDQMHEVSDAELESMISSNTGDIESLDDDSLGSNDTSVDNEVYDDDDMTPNYDPKTNLDGDIDSIDDQNDALEYEGSDDGSDDEDSVLSNTKISESESSSTSTSPVAQLSVIDSDDDQDDDSDDEALDNKFEIEGLNEFLAKYHPESKQHNYDEIYALSEVIRDSKGIIIDDLHKTLPIMSKYEKTRVLGQRAKQINSGNKPFVTVPKNIMDGYLIAQEELMQKKLPFIIRRPLPSGGSEYWRIKDLEILY
jgi:DNA-directed RNA polymerase I, II, and III subunit RPABC2